MQEIKLLRNRFSTQELRIKYCHEVDKADFGAFVHRNTILVLFGIKVEW